ncbi:DUF4166 domain-containing protein [Ramlibacter sp. MAH-25]|uniref:DUF4166 domain-containing protein n=2 Tax=Ramlibacter pinisoli TaxID=2682844 RepID=A0A6N8IRQ7_9BURK|nr:MULTISPECIES: DUF4166 domain-containing protein [Ramlibacter]MBA2964446.1 DUF4166 domain-containing protein [Ramlibacter sp. CGMCC 1.13660]MVQ29412.1 DUF4166 domain-containing protein [Ramlibacter pinisoli]
MGPQFAQLPSPLQHFHALAGAHVLSGWVEVEAPASRAARLLARCLGAPLNAHQGPIRFELEAGAAEEVWTRHFPGKTMRSRLTQAAGHIVERLGFAQLRFGLEGDVDMLEMKLVQLRFLGVPCPRWLLPAVVAEETATPGQLHFRVKASLPLIGVVASYRGYLKLPAEVCQ